MSKHEHYPCTPEQGLELYEDLRDFAGLTHDAAVETVGFEASRQVWSCEDTGPVMAFMTASSGHAYPFSQEADMEIYQRGAGIGAEAGSTQKETQHV